MASVSLSGVSKTYAGNITAGNITAVRDIDLSVADGEFVVLVGPSGCGKSTTLRLIAGLEEPTAGGIAIGGRTVNDLPPKDRDVAMVFQDHALYPHLTVADNMAFALKLRRHPRSEIQQAVNQAAETLGLTDLLKRRPDQLSGGERQRVALGRAVVRQPKVFLLDEPLSDLDAAMRVQLRVEIKRLHHALGRTMIYVTHDQTEAMTMGDRIVVMRGGVIQQIAAPRELYGQPANAFVAGFIGTPAMNLLPGRLQHDGQQISFVSDFVRLPLPDAWTAALGDRPDRRVLLGVRPHDLAVDGAGEASFTATVDMVEPLGSDTYLYLNCGGATLISRADPDHACQAGQNVTLAVNMSRSLLFDADTEAAISKTP